MLARDAILISRYNEWTGDLSVIGICDTKARADRVVSNDIDQYIETDVFKKQLKDLGVGYHIRYEQDQTKIFSNTNQVIVTYTFTEMPTNELVDVSKF
jgi:hypothetical protein